MSDIPILYSFRRCPYAMRARMALIVSQTDVEHREILLSDKPPQLLAASPKGTVPVVVLPDGSVLEQSLDVMYWALSRNDPEHWLNDGAADLISQCDGAFKYALDRYKYADRHPEPAEIYRDMANSFLERLEQRLSRTDWLLGGQITVADVAIFPFIRQFAAVDREWFEQCAGTRLNQWLSSLLEWPIFTRSMRKHPLWAFRD